MTAASGSVSSDRTYTYDQNGNEIKIVDSVAETGRFLTEDTYRGETDDADSWHLYVYCANNPINYTDPSGHIALATCVIVGAVIGGTVGGVASYLKYKKVKGWWVLTGAVAGGIVGYVGGAYFGASGIKEGTLAAKIKMSRVRKIGKFGEKIANIPKNKKRIDSLTGTAKYRVPDYLNKKYGILCEVKNVKKLSYTKQLQDYMLYAKQEGYTFCLQIRKNTKLSSSLKKLVDAGDITILYLK